MPNTLRHLAFRQHGELSVAANGCYFLDACRRADPLEDSGSLASRETSENMIRSSFVQILSKLYFVQLSENLRRILVD
jgi:hypothetical protein